MNTLAVEPRDASGENHVPPVSFAYTSDFGVALIDSAHLSGLSVSDNNDHFVTADW